MVTYPLLWAMRDWHIFCLPNIWWTAQWDTCNLFWFIWSFSSFRLHPSSNQGEKKSVERIFLKRVFRYFKISVVCLQYIFGCVSDLSFPVFPIGPLMISAGSCNMAVTGSFGAWNLSISYTSVTAYYTVCMSSFVSQLQQFCSVWSRKSFQRVTTACWRSSVSN